MIKVRTIDPEYQRVDFGEYFDLREEGIVIEENRNYRGFNDEELKTAEKLCEDMECGYEYDAGYYGLTEEQFAKLREIVGQIKTWREIKEEFVAEFLSMKYGKPYERFTLRGCVQSEWVYAWLPSDSTRKWVDLIEMIFFNLGIEVVVGDGEDEYYQYLPTWDEREIKQ